MEASLQRLLTIIAEEEAEPDLHSEWIDEQYRKGFISALNTVRNHIAFIDLEREQEQQHEEK